ncbi:UNVERIFIED_CONTAM: hypothetical protein FKN15_014584 [Acipenser sinensis]
MSRICYKHYVFFSCRSSDTLNECTVYMSRTCYKYYVFVSYRSNNGWIECVTGLIKTLHSYRRRCSDCATRNETQNQAWLIQFGYRWPE